MSGGFCPGEACIREGGFSGQHAMQIVSWFSAGACWGTEGSPGGVTRVITSTCC